MVVVLSSARIRTWLVIEGLVLLALVAHVAAAHAGTYYISECSYFGNTGPAFTPASTAAHLSPGNDCLVWSGSAYRSYEINESGGSVLEGYSAEFSATSPSPAIMIIHAYTPGNTVLVDCALKSDGFGAEFFWGNDGTNYGTQSINYTSGCSGGVGYATGISQAIQPSRYFGWTVGCEFESSCHATSSGSRILAVNGIQLEAEETTGPALIAVGSNNLWYQQGWVRGTWPAAFEASDPSGVCDAQTTVDGQTVASWTDTAPDPTSWTQCHGTGAAAAIDTTKYPDGDMSLSFYATDAAGNGTGPSRSATANPVLVDNTPVSLSLSGPTDALSTAGTQYVTATAAAGPSGVGGIACTVDGSPYRWHAGVSTAIPIDGLGQHQVSCYAQNNSYDVAGNPATSPLESWTMTIRQPTVFGIGFTKLVDALRCKRVLVRIKTPGKWVTIHRDHKPVWVFRHGKSKLVSKVRCRPRTEVHREVVWTTVRRHGKLVRVKHVKLVRIVVLPHEVSADVRRLVHGQGSTISGWLGTSSGTALGGQTVELLTAADNGAGQFRTAAVVTTAANGSWSRSAPRWPVPADRSGVSRYHDDRARELGSGEGHGARESTNRHPASLDALGRDDSHPRTPARWLRATFRELVVLWIGWNGGSTEIGHRYTGPEGRFSTPYTFLRGNGTETYRLWAATARESRLSVYARAVALGTRPRPLWVVDLSPLGSCSLAP